jgi:hypothetical protein
LCKFFSREKLINDAMSLLVALKFDGTHFFDEVLVQKGVFGL